MVGRFIGACAGNFWCDGHIRVVQAVQDIAGYEKLIQFIRNVVGRIPKLRHFFISTIPRLIEPHGNVSFSQEGEDLVVRRLLQHQGPGFYVDVGAHHPSRFSNTRRFYDQGWRGINVDPNPESIRLFRKMRPHDISVQAGVAEKEGVLTLYLFDDPALNTFDEKLKDERVERWKCQLSGSLPVRVVTLSDLLGEFLPAGQVIDFLTIDAEGLDLQVLKSNDWSRYRPRWVLVESLNLSLSGLEKDEQCRFMASVGYAPCAKTLNTVFYKDVRDE